MVSTSCDGNRQATGMSHVCSTSLRFFVNEGLGLYEHTWDLNGRMLVVHNLKVDTSLVDMHLVLNERGNGYAWGDATVRGLVEYEPWMSQYFAQTNAVFRCMSMDAYVRALKADALLAADCNGNLFWNLGHWVYANGTLYKHYREVLKGRQVAFTVATDGRNEVRPVNFDSPNVFRDLRFAVSGIRIVSKGQPVDLLGVDTDTGRPVVSEFYGDMTHLLSTGACVPINRALFANNSEELPEDVNLSNMTDFSRRIFEKDCTRRRLAKLAATPSKFLRDAVLGQSIEIPITEVELSGIRESLRSAGYCEGLINGPGRFFIEADRLTIALKRSTFGYSMLSTTRQGSILITKVYTDESRRGGTVEDMANIVVHSARTLGLDVTESIITSSGADLRIHLTTEVTPQCMLSRSLDGTPLIYRGVEDYGVTSALVLARRKT